MDKHTILMTLINLTILLFAPFFVIGVIKKTKAFWGGRKGVSIFQPFWDFLRLLKKSRVISSSTSPIFNIAFVIVFVSTLIAGLFAPLVMGFSIINTSCAFIIFSYILGFSKFFALIGAMDTASSFEGMGASREACFTTIIEPAFFIILASLIALSGNYTFSSISQLPQNFGSLGILIIITASSAIFIMLLTECSRVPVDDPATHLELTMIHEVMVLDNSGIDLALSSWANGIKMVILMGIIGNLIIPAAIPLKISLLCFIALFIILGVIIGTIESLIARLRMSHVFEFIFVMSSLALVVASLSAVKIYGV